MRKPTFESFDVKHSELKNARLEIEHFESPARILLARLQPNIDKLKYDSVLGDDATARIHALILSRAIREIYGERKNISTVFVQGGRLLRSDEPFKGPSQYDEFLKSSSEDLDGMSEEEFDDQTENLSTEPRLRDTTHAEEVASYLKRMKPRLGKRTLIVTEEISSGSSIDKLVSILESHGIMADVVSFGIAEDEGVTNRTFVTEGGTQILLGTYNSGPTVSKESLGVFPSARSGYGHAVKRPFIQSTEKEREQLRAIREAAKELSHKLAQEYLKTKERV